MKRQKESAPQFSGGAKFSKRQGRKPKADRYVQKPPQKRKATVPADEGAVPDGAEKGAQDE